MLVSWPSVGHRRTLELLLVLGLPNKKDEEPKKRLTLFLVVGN